MGPNMDNKRSASQFVDSIEWLTRGCGLVDLVVLKTVVVGLGRVVVDGFLIDNYLDDLSEFEKKTVGLIVDKTVAEVVGS